MLIQKYHSALWVQGDASADSSAGSLFSRQGHWDGGSTLHCAAMALALLGKLNDPVWLPYHDRGNEQTFWNHAWPHYLHGLTLSELAGFIAELDLGIRPVVHTNQGVPLFDFAARELQAARPVIVGWRQRHPVRLHAALVTGIEGRQTGRTFEVHALLLMDPAGDAPRISGYNARLEWHTRSTFYRSPNDMRAVTLIGAVSLRAPVSADAGA